MLVITEADLRRMWQDGRGTLAPMPRDARLTPSARDFIKHWNLEIPYVDEPAVSDSKRPTWDRPGTFPVQRSGTAPVCNTCGQAVADKPGHLTQLDAGYIAPKTTPRLLFRGKMDTLQAHFLVTGALAQRLQLSALTKSLDTLTAYCREITSAEYHGRKVAPLEMDGQNADAIQAAIHRPEDSLGVAHLVPSADDHEMLLQLNLLRCQVRENELAGATVFTDTDHRPTRSDLIQALNRLSSAVYLLALRFKAEHHTPATPGGSEQTP